MMAKRLTCVLERLGVKILGWPNFTALQTVCATSTSTQVAVLPWRYVVDMGTTTSLHASGRNTMSIMKCLVLVSVYSIV